MPGLLELCREQFGSTDLYSVLGVSKDAKPNEIRKGYHTVSLEVHPDRVAGKKAKVEATEKFQTLGRAYQILSDKDTKAVYDETGEVDEDSSTLDNKDWVKYWRTLFRKVTVQDIKNFEKDYVGSVEELHDLEVAYNEGEGCMDYILDTVLLCSVDDEPRFRAVIDGWIEDGRVEAFPAYVKETNKTKSARKRKAEKEAAEAEQMRQELCLGSSDDDLKALILSRGKSREQHMDAFLDGLAEKYATKKGKKSKK